MKSTNRILTLLIALGFLSACNKTIEDFVRNTAPQTGKIEVLPQATSSKMIKVSPGHSDMVGSHYHAQATVSTTKRSVAGTQYRAQLSINQQRR